MGIAAVASSAWLVELAAAGVVVLPGIAGVLLFSRRYIERGIATGASAGSCAGSSATPSSA